MMAITISTMVIFVNRKDRINQTNSSTLDYSLKALSGYNLLLTTILAFPFFDIFMATFICRNDDDKHGDMECYKGIYFLHIVVAIIGMVILLVTTYIFGLLSMDLNPWSKVPYAAPGSRMNIIKLSFKILIILYVNLDYNNDLTKGFIVVFAIFWLLILILRYFQTPCYNKSVFNFMLGTEMTTFWASLVIIFHAFIDDYPPDNMGFLFLIIGIPPLVYGYIIIVDARASYFRKLHIKNFKRDTDFEMYLLNIISLIENRDDPDKRMSLEGLLKFHIKFCNRDENNCACYPLARDYLKEGQDAPETLWYTWTRIMIIEAMEKFYKSARLHVLYAFIEREKLDNRFKALYELTLSESVKPSFEEEFSIYRYKNVIETEMIANDVRNTELKGGIDVNLVVDFQNKFMYFQELIETSVELHLDFWKELLEQNPEIQKLQSLGTQITTSVDQTFNQFKALTKINSNQIKMLQMYGYYLRDIINDEIEGQLVLEKSDYVTKSNILNQHFIDSDKLKYGENSNTCLITVTCNDNNMGLVSNVNSEITRILNYPKEEIIGQNINSVMPRVIADRHDAFLKRYLGTSQARVMNIERLVFPINKKGYLVPCTLMIKVLPNLSEGIRIVGFLREVEGNDAENETNKMNQQDNDNEDEKGTENDQKAHYIMYDGETAIIYGITEGFHHDFGIPISLINGTFGGTSDFRMDSILPNVLNLNIEELQSPQGLTVEIDTRTLRENHLIAHNMSDDDSKELDAETKEKRYRKASMKARLIQNEYYEGANVKVLKISEIIDEPVESPDGKEISHKISNRRKAEDIAFERQQLEEAEANKKFLERTGSVAHSVGSEMESSSVEMNEEIRLIKDFKLLISAKTTTRAITILRNVVILMCAMLLILVCVGFSFRFDQADEFKESITVINDAYLRHTKMGEANLRVRNMELYTKGLLNVPSGTTASDFATDLQSKGLALFDTLRTISLDIGENQNLLEPKGLATIESDKVKTEVLIQTGLKIESRIFSDAMSQYLSHGTSVSTNDIAEFVSTDLTVTVPSSFYYVKRNGYGSLRDKSELNAQTFFSFYDDRTDKFNTKFLVIMIAAIVVLVVSEAILVPIVFSVHKTANQVLSLFGFIPLKDIDDLAIKCEDYMLHFLEDHKTHKKFSFAEGEEGAEEEMRYSRSVNYKDSSYVEASQNQEEECSISQDHGDDLESSQKLDNSMAMLSAKNRQETMNSQETNRLPNHIISLKIPFNRRPTTSQSPGLETEGEGERLETENKIFKTETAAPLIKKSSVVVEEKDENKKNEHEEEGESPEERSQKLMNTKEKIGVRVGLQFAIIGILFLAYFIADYVHNHSVLNNIKTSLSFLKIGAEREANIRFLNGFTLEEVADGSPNAVYNYTYGNWVNLRSYYSSQTTANIQLTSSSNSQDLPSAFDAYLSTFDALSTGNICKVYYGQDSTKQADCEAISNGLLTQGFTIAIVRIVQNCEDILKTFNTTARDDSAKSTIINGDEFTETNEIVEYLAPLLEDIQAEYMSDFENYLGDVRVIDKVKFSIFIILAVLFFIFIWLPYKRGLDKKIFRTKGMLKMIPIDIIMRDENLKNRFLHGNILQAVK